MEEKRDPIPGPPVTVKRGEQPELEAWPDPAPRRGIGFRSLKRLPFRYQPEETDCGPACLGMVGDYHRRPVLHARLRDLTSVSQEGCSLLSIQEAAEDIGYLARGVKVEGANDLRGAPLPAIAHVGTNHFVVIYGVKRNRVIVADPAVGLRRVPIRKFMEDWDGVLLLLQPTPEPMPTTPEGKTGFSRFLRYFEPHKAVIAELFIATLFLQLLGLVIPFATQTIIDRVFVNSQDRLLLALLVVMLGTVLFSALIRALRTFLLYDMVRRADQALVSDLHHQLFRLPLNFFSSRKLGDLLVRFSDNEKVRGFLTSVMFGVTLDVMLGSLYLLVLVSFDFGLTVIGLAPVPFLVFRTWLVAPRLKVIQRECAIREGDAQSALVEALSSVVTVKGCVAERTERRRYEQLFDRLLGTEVRAQRLQTVSGVVGSVVVASGQALVLYAGALKVLDGTLTVGTFVAFSFVLSQVIAPTRRLLGAWERFQDCSVSLERLSTVFDSDLEEPEDTPRLELEEVQGQLAFEGVTFRYDRDDAIPVFEDFSLRIEPGEKVAIVGRSGAGKTTLVHLALKLRSPEVGVVRLDGHDLRLVSARSLRAAVGYVPQRIELFSGTIAQNIALGREVTLEEIQEAAQAANIHETIEKRARNYQTLVGEHSMTRFSGGELQRLAIARALIGDPRFLILDEPTSALDAESEGALLRTLESTDRRGQKRTVLMLAHRLGFARRADRIVVLDEGRVVEDGTHAELLALDQLYAKFYREQVG